MVIAIDGPAGVGKSSLAHRIAREMDFFNLNSGAFYRAVALKILDLGLQNAPRETLIEAADHARLDVVDNNLYLDGREVESRLRSDLVDHWSSVLSSIVPIRHAVNRHLHRIAKGLSLVAEGRDMTTVVFPQADIKIYLTANPDVRALRRFRQGSSAMSLSEIKESIQDRDTRDTHKEEGSLSIAKDAVVVDTSNLTIDEVYIKVMKLIQPVYNK